MNLLLFLFDLSLSDLTIFERVLIEATMLCEKSIERINIIKIIIKKRLIRLNEINPVSLFSLFKTPETRITP